MSREPLAGGTILVTGGAGFIGGNFVLRAVAAGWRVVTLDALTYAGNRATLAAVVGDPDHVFVEGSIGDRELVARLLEEYRPRAIVNFAAETHVDRSIDGPREFVRTNVTDTLELLEAARAHHAALPAGEREGFRLLHVSTDEVYGSLGEEGLFTEETPYAPNSPYSASKAAADHLVRAYHHTYGLPTLTTNCSNNYGPYQYPEKLVPLMVYHAAQGKPLPVYGDGGNVRDWLYVEDHCRAIETVLAAGEPGRVYNVGGSGSSSSSHSSERTNLEVVRTICAALDEQLPDSPHTPHSGLITFVADRPGHDRRYAMDATRLRTELGWEPRESFESGLQKTVRWYLANEEWTREVIGGRYAGERLGLSGGAG